MNRGQTYKLLSERGRYRPNLPFCFFGGRYPMILITLKYYYILIIVWRCNQNHQLVMLSRGGYVSLADDLWRFVWSRLSSRQVTSLCSLLYILYIAQAAMCQCVVVILLVCRPPHAFLLESLGRHVINSEIPTSSFFYHFPNVAGELSTL